MVQVYYQYPNQSNFINEFNHKSFTRNMIQNLTKLICQQQVYIIQTKIQIQLTTQLYFNLNCIQQAKMISNLNQPLSGNSTNNNDSFGQSKLAHYNKLDTIGKGAYGVVCRAVDLRTKQTVALKRVTVDAFNQGLPSTSIREISLLRQLDHKNVVKLKDVIYEDSQLYLIFQYVDKDLRCFLQTLDKKQMLDPMTVKKFMFQLLSGISECHMRRIIHRDLKPANLLIDKNQNLKIADFGLARTFSLPVRPYSREVVTLWYRAPEILLGATEYSTGIDIWAIGCIFVEMVTKKPLFAGDSDIDQLYRIFRVLGTPNETNWTGVSSLRDYRTTFPNYPQNPIQTVIHGLNLDLFGLDLLKRMLTYDPTKRITAKAALHHPYFKQLNSNLKY